MLRSLPRKLRVTTRRQFPHNITSRAAFDEAVDAHVMDCLTPEKPFLSRDSSLVTMGSCFAQNIAKLLGRKGYDVHRFDVQERLFTTMALQAFLEGLAAEQTDLSMFESNWRLSPDQIIATQQKIASGATVIVTLGLSVAWFDVATDEIIFDPARKVGARILYDNPDKYEMRTTSVPLNIEAIVGIIGALRRMCPDNKIILTLSPIHLHSAAGDYPVVVADSISKSVLRAALDDVMQRKFKDVYYFPSFEILKWLAPMVDKVWLEDNLLTHIRNDWIAYVLSKFAQYYCEGESGSTPPIHGFPDRDAIAQSPDGTDIAASENEAAIISMIMSELVNSVMSATTLKSEDVYSLLKQLLWSIPLSIRKTPEDQRQVELTGEALVATRIAIGAEPCVWSERGIEKTGTRDVLQQTQDVWATDILKKAFSQDCDCVIELGCEQGIRIFDLWNAGGPRQARYVGADNLDSSRDAARKIATLFPDMQVDWTAFDFAKPIFDHLLNNPMRIGVFTHHAIDRITTLSPTLIDRLVSRFPGAKITGVHFEPFDFQMMGRKLTEAVEPMGTSLSARQLGVNLFAQIASHPKIRIRTMEADVIKYDGDKATSLLVWSAS